MERIIYFKHWKTGENKRYDLDASSIYSQRLTKTICPFDKTPIVFRSNEIDQSCFCPNCESEYSKNSSQEEINQEFKLHLQDYKKDLSRLEYQKGLLEARVKHAEKQGF